MPQNGVSVSTVSLLDRGDVAEAEVMWALLTSQPEWVRRRVECVDFLDHKTARRRVSIDYEIPEGLFGTLGRLRVVPITVLQKSLLRRFDLRDEVGAAVPMLGQRENSVLSANALIFTAETIVGGPIPPYVAEILGEITSGQATAARDQIAQWPFRNKAALTLGRHHWSKLLESTAFMESCQVLASNFVLYAAAESRTGERRILKLSYEEPISQFTESLPKQAAATFGWRRKGFGLPAPAVSQAESYHLEVSAPQDLTIDVALLRFREKESA